MAAKDVKGEQDIAHNNVGLKAIYSRLAESQTAKVVIAFFDGMGYRRASAGVEAEATR